MTGVQVMAVDQWILVYSTPQGDAQYMTKTDTAIERQARGA